MLVLARARILELVSIRGCPPEVRAAASSVLTSMEADTKPSLDDSWVVLLYALVGDSMIDPALHSDVQPRRSASGRRHRTAPGPASGPAQEPSAANGARSATPVRDPTGLGLRPGHFETREDGRRVFVED